jgi:hypothetical protein
LQDGSNFGIRLKILSVDTADFSKWMMNVYFAMYSWNASPIDGTDIVWSFAEKAQTFNFPLDVQEEPVTIIGNPSEHAVQHVETMFQLRFHQKSIVNMITPIDKEGNFSQVILLSFNDKFSQMQVQVALLNIKCGLLNIKCGHKVLTEC